MHSSSIEEDGIAIVDATGDERIQLKSYVELCEAAEGGRSRVLTISL